MLGAECKEKEKETELGEAMSVDSVQSEQMGRPKFLLLYSFAEV